MIWRGWIQCVWQRLVQGVRAGNYHFGLHFDWASTTQTICLKKCCSGFNCHGSGAAYGLICGHLSWSWMCFVGEAAQINVYFNIRRLLGFHLADMNYRFFEVSFVCRQWQWWWFRWKNHLICRLSLFTATTPYWYCAPTKRIPFQNMKIPIWHQPTQIGGKFAEKVLGKTTNEKLWGCFVRWICLIEKRFHFFLFFFLRHVFWLSHKKQIFCWGKESA